MNQHLDKLLLPLGIAVGSSLVLLLIRRVLLRYTDRWMQKNAPNIDGMFVSVIRAPSIYLCLATGLYVGVATSGLSPRYSHTLFEVIHSIVILSITLAVANFSVALFRNFMARTKGIHQTSGLLNGLIRGGVIGVGVMVILSVLGISVAPLLTALGVGGLAVALALKDTLENLFAGIYLLSDRALKVGDYIKLESGLEGFVEDISWRTTRVRLEDSNLLVLPNTKLAQTSVVNFCLPDRKIMVTVAVPVAYGSDPQRVEDELSDIIKKGSEDIVGLLASPSPGVRFNPGFGADSLDFTLYFYVKDFSDRSFVRHEVRKRIYKRFGEIGMEFPKKTLVLTKEAEIC
jgi:small-conductance mechanosensitive channel